MPFLWIMKIITRMTNRPLEQGNCVIGDKGMSKEAMFNPPHPGEIVKSLLIEESGLSVTEAAQMLDVTRGAISKLINCHSGISPQMAIRLSIALGTTSKMWFNLQNQYDLWQAEQQRKKLRKHVWPLKEFKKAS